MSHVPYHLTAEASFALWCAAGIVSPFVIKLTESLARSSQSTTLRPRSHAAGVARSSDDPATIALVKSLSARDVGAAKPNPKPADR